MKTLQTTAAFLLSLFVLRSVSYATNGDILTGDGPISLSLGGVGVAAPQDAITAIAANPAALSLRTGVQAPVVADSASGKDAKADTPPEAPDYGVETNFGANIFLPFIKGETNGVSAGAHATVYPIPEIAVAIPLTKDRAWYFGLAAYGSSGLGVDYRGTALDNSKYFNFGPGGVAPLGAGIYTNYENLKFVPAVSYRISPQWSIGLGLQIDYSTLDLGQGTTSAFSVGVQPGIVYRPIQNLTFGASYTTPQPATFKRVDDFTGNGTLNDLKLESPQEVIFGGAYEAFDHRLLLEADGKWINWGGADGYKDFGWKDEWVAAVGAQFAIIPEKLFVRAGYDFGNNPVKSNNGFNGAFGPTGPQSYNQVQGISIPTYYYEAFRVIGYPAVVEDHLSFGVGYAFNKHFTVNLAYSHAFSHSVTENGTNPFGQPTTIGSKLSEDSVDIGLTWRF